MADIPLDSLLFGKNIQQTVEEHLNSAKFIAAGSNAILARALIENNIATAIQHLERIIEINDEIEALNIRAANDINIDKPTLDSINMTLEPRFEEVRQYAQRSRDALAHLEKLRSNTAVQDR